MADDPHVKREISRLEPSGRLSSEASQSQAKAHSRHRTSRACDYCRKARAKCTGGQPCKICHGISIECVYSDRKRELNKKLVEKLTDEIKELSRTSQRYGDTLRRLRLNDALPEAERTAISNLLGEQGSTHDDESVMDVDEPADGKAERGASHADTPGDARDTGFDGVTDTPETSSKSRSPQSENSGRVAPPLRKEVISEDTRMILDPFEQGQHPSERQQFGQPPSDLKYALTDPFLQEPPMMSHFRAKREEPFPVESWTKVVNSRALIEHLMSLYFCWEYPTFASLSMRYFLQDFYQGRHRYCSSLLVNAILALGSRFSELPEARQDISDPDTAGDLFFEECKWLLASEEVASLPTIQAICLMSLRQASRGNDTSSWFYARQAMDMAIGMDLHLHQHVHGLPEDILPDVELEVRNATFWGCFDLEQVWCLCMGRLPQLRRDEIRIGKPQLHLEEEQEDWVPYTDNGQPLEYDYKQRSHTRTVYKSLSELSEIIHDTLMVIYLHRSGKKSSQILEAYTRYLDWFQALPNHLRTGENYTPTVLFTHMYYHFAVILLFRPFLNLTLRDSSISPPQVCLQAAESLTWIIETYRQLYTLRRTPSFVPIMILTSNLALLTANGIFRRDPTDGDESFSGAGTIRPDHHNWLQFLQELSVPHQFARKSIHILLHFARLWNIPLPEGISRTTLPTAVLPASVRFKGKEDANEGGHTEEGDEELTQDDGRKRSPRPTSPFYPRADLSLPSDIESLFDATTGDVLFSLFPAQGVPFLASTNQRMEEERGLDDIDDGKGRRGRGETKLSREGFQEALRSDGLRGGASDERVEARKP